MRSLTNEQMTKELTQVRHDNRAGRIGRRIGMFLLTLVGGLVALISLLPVGLLPLVTAVPLPFFLLLAAADLALLGYLFVRAETVLLRTAVIGGLLAVSVLAVLLSQWYATTPPILGADGNPLPGSIAELEAVELNGRTQWISLRGQDTNKPVLLFLAGGPGGTQLAATRKMLGGLEEHFVVVNWEQPGAGKSYRAADFSSLTPEQYIADGHELTLYLLERFDEEKIYIMGESWGTLLGLWLVQDHPERYHAFAGIAQMVAFLETDTYDYNLALEIAEERGDTNTIDALRQQGPPPYYGDGVALKVTRYVMYLSQYMMQNPAITGPGYDTFGDIGAPEYGLYDKVNYFWGLLRTMETLWPQLWDVDMRQQVPQVDVPVYFMEGRHDVNAPPELAEDYLQKLDAPHKELIWFEHSGHSPWVDEAEKTVDVMVNTVLANTTP
ncbi:MAG: alpha/beta hydrolase [Anaerolineaceae bacterium]|nr:alpha/beta hydrolase [Anaerolineaceae bacterium]